MATPGCYAAYTELAADDRAAEYRGCWQTAPSGPVGGSCANLDAYACSRHDNCTAHYKDNFVRTSEPVPVSEFLFCAPEVAASAALSAVASADGGPSSGGDHPPYAFTEGP